MPSKCEIRYKVLDPHLIFNYIGPSAGYHRKEDCELLTNMRIETRNARDNFYNKLESSVLKEGFRNPIIVNAGWISGAVLKNLPDSEQKKGMENLIFCFQIGGSRLWVAQKHNIPIPCIIRDFVGRFSDCPLLDSEAKVRKRFTDQPITVSCSRNHVAIAWSGVKV